MRNAGELKRRDFVKLVGLGLGALGARVLGTTPAVATASQRELPPANPLFLIQTHVAGTTYVKGIDTLAASIMVGDRLELLREPTNQYDELAILVRTQGEVKVGYVPRKDNAVLARLMDAGKPVFATVASKQQLGAWHQIGISIFLVE